MLNKNITAQLVENANRLFAGLSVEDAETQPVIGRMCPVIGVRALPPKQGAEWLQDVTLLLTVPGSGVSGLAKKVYGDFNTPNHIVLELVLKKEPKEPVLFIIYNTVKGVAYFIRMKYTGPTSYYMVGICSIHK